MASLFVIQGRDQGKRFDLTESIISIGRDKTCDIQLHDSEISRLHAEVHVQEDGFYFADLQSSNGSYVNDELVENQQLSSGDRLFLGRTMLLFTAGQEGRVSEIASQVDIVGHDIQSESRIIQSISHEAGSQLLATVGPEESPWLARARSNLQIMYRTALAVSHTLDIDQLLQRIMELIFEWVETDRGCIMLLDSQTQELEPKVSLNREGSQAEQGKLEISRTILDYVLERKEGVLTSDASEDRRWDAAASIVTMGIREAICVPMQGRYGIVGVIYIDTYSAPGRRLAAPTNRFSEEHLKLMIAIAHQAALAVEDTSYYSAMVQAERLAAMGQTIATLSHHIKNILQGIRGGSYLIEEGLKNEEADVVRKGWGIVERNQEKISHLVMDMLTFSKERAPEITTASLNEVAADVVELMETRSAEAGVGLEYHAAAEMPEFSFDPEMIHRALLNVVTNAIDACQASEDGTVSVSTEFDPESARVRVLVRDNGVGMSQDELKRVFAVFESSKGNRGTGLGLPVSQKILREHGGDILATSAPGQGSCFTLEFPAVIPEPADPDTMAG